MLSTLTNSSNCLMPVDKAGGKETEIEIKQKKKNQQKVVIFHQKRITNKEKKSGLLCN